MPGMKHWKWIAALAAGSAALLFLYVFPPEEYPFYPRCMLLSLTGLACPGCGGLRAVHQLLHGNFGAAIELNPLIVILLPVCCLAMGAYLIDSRRNHDLLRKPVWLWTLFAVGILFGIARNLP